MTLLEQLAERHTTDVVYSAIGLTIEKIAAEVSRELLQDAAFREELKAVTRASLKRTVRALRPKAAPARRRRVRR